jgi:hypothetical protein
MGWMPSVIVVALLLSAFTFGQAAIRRLAAAQVGSGRRSGDTLQNVERAARSARNGVDGGALRSLVTAVAENTGFTLSDKASVALIESEIAFRSRGRAFVDTPVWEAFNSLMRRLDAPENFATDEQETQMLRRILKRSVPDLVGEDVVGESPVERMFIILVLLRQKLSPLYVTREAWVQQAKEHEEQLNAESSQTRAVLGVWEASPEIVEIGRRASAFMMDDSVADILVSTFR